MVDVSFRPPSFVARMAPGSSVTRTFEVQPASADEELVARIEGPTEVARMRHIAVYQRESVPCTDDDLKVLPSFPPSLRERARSECIRETELNRMPEGLPVQVASGNAVRVEVDITAPPVEVQIHATTLVVEGRNWARTEVPIVVMSGESELEAQYYPPRIDAAVRPGTVGRYEIVLPSVPSAASAIALFKPANPFVRITAVRAYRLERREYTEDEIAEAPEELRETMRKEGYLFPVQVAEVGAGQRIEVPWPGGLRVSVEIAPPASTASVTPYSYSTLDIIATNWRIISVPVAVHFAHVEVSFPLASATLRQGSESDPFEASLTAQAMDTEVRFELGTDWEAWHVIPNVVQVRAGHTAFPQMRIGVGERAPVGVHATTLRVSWLGGVGERTTPFQLTVLPGAVTVRSLQPEVVASQGDRVGVRVQIKSAGGHKRVVFSPGLLPRGVTLEPLVWERDGAAFETVTLFFVIDPQARSRDRARVTIGWNAGDSEHGGSLELRLTVHLRPESRTFSQPVVTPQGTPLGGHAELTIANDGHGRFRGHMRATGALSYAFRVRAVARSGDGRWAVTGQKTGAVKGTFQPGAELLEWDEPIFSGEVRDHWPAFRTATMAVSKSYEMTGPLGALLDVFGDLMEFVWSAALLSPLPGGPALAGLVLVGSEMDKLAGLRIVGPGGLVGLAAAGAGTVLVGPGVVVPLFVGGVLATSSAIRHRKLTEGERVALRVVFGDSIPFERVILTNATGLGGARFVAPNIDAQILVNLGDNFDDVMKPTPDYRAPGQLFMHEMTHAWQLARLDSGRPFVWNWAMDQLDGIESYFYGPPGPEWSSFTQEAQASVVDDWFAGKNDRAIAPVRDRQPQSESDPYFPYIANNIRMGQS